MLQLVASQPEPDPTPAPEPAGDYGAWTGYRIAQDRSGWHPQVRAFYEYWLSVAPAGQLPGRQHIRPEQIPSFLSRLLLFDVTRDPPRFRYRLCGTELVRSLGREVTGMWLDEAHPQFVANPASRERFRYIVETGRPTWRRGPPLWSRHADHRSIESCIVPLAADGRTVNKVIGFSMLFDSQGRPF
jgi:PAS domain